LLTTCEWCENNVEQKVIITTLLLLVWETTTTTNLPYTKLHYLGFKPTNCQALEKGEGRDKYSEDNTGLERTSNHFLSYPPNGQV
jgi:hypothetical protein